MQGQKLYKLLLIAFLFGLLLILIGCVLGFKVFDEIVRNEIINNVQLERNSEQWSRFVEQPFPLTFNVFVFNITNPGDILQGEKPILNEIGPYVYALNRKKKEINYDDKSSVSYYQYAEYKFDGLASAPLTENDKINILNVPFNAMMQVVENVNVESMILLDNFWNEVFNEEKSLFHDVRIDEYFFGGYSFCQPKYVKYFGRIICWAVRTTSKWPKNLELQEDGSVVFSFFRYKNVRHDGYYEVNTGMDDIFNVAKIKKWNNFTYADFWNGNSSECNKICGIDTSVFPPFNDRNTVFTIYSTDICRKVNLHYEKDVTYEGIDGLMYRLPMNAFNGSEECYCTRETKNLDGQEECLPEGLIDLHTCFQAPVTLSHPHLIGVDERYLQTINGLSPDVQKHLSFVEIEPETGTPLQGAKRVQINMILRKINMMRITENITSAIIPLIWIEERMDLPTDYVDQLKTLYLNKLITLDAIQWSLIGLGLLLSLGSFVMYIYLTYCRRIKVLIANN